MDASAPPPPLKLKLKIIKPDVAEVKPSTSSAASESSVSKKVTKSIDELIRRDDSSKDDEDDEIVKELKGSYADDDYCEFKKKSILVLKTDYFYFFILQIKSILV